MHKQINRTFQKAKCVTSLGHHTQCRSPYHCNMVQRVGTHCTMITKPHIIKFNELYARHHSNGTVVVLIQTNTSDCFFFFFFLSFFSIQFIAFTKMFRMRSLRSFASDEKKNSPPLPLLLNIIFIIMVRCFAWQ